MIDVVVPVFNQYDLVTQCIDCLLQQHDIGRIIVVDDASTEPKLVDYLLSMSFEGFVALLRHDENIGFLGSANHGMRYVETEYGVIVNSDTAPLSKTSLFTLVAEMHDVRFHVAGARLLFMDGSRHGRNATIQHAGVAFNPDGVPYHPFMGLHKDTRAANITRAVNAVTGAVFAVRMDVWARLGGFDNQFAPGVYEDVDFCLRSGKVLYVPGSAWYHKMHGSQVSGYNLFEHENEHLNLLIDRWSPTSDEHIFYGV